MTNVRLTLKSLALMAFMFAVASVANAQATRTWVSGVGVWSATLRPACLPQLP